MNEERATQVGVGIGVALIVVGALSYMKATKLERAKRKKIESWRQENLACIRNYEKRMREMAEDPNIDVETFVRAFHEESKFLNIVYHQPKY